MDERSPRRKGAEVRAALWMARHPAMTGAPVLVVGCGQVVGWTVTAIVAAGLLLGCLGWYRGHPQTFDRHIAPRLRASWRRWSSYVGPRWRRALLACELSRTHRRTGYEQTPRITKVRSYSPMVDTVWARLLPGQSVRHFEERLPELAETLRVERIAVERIKPGTVGLVIQRREPFTEIIDAPEMPPEPGMVDLGSVYAGETEYATPWRIPVLGQHLFVAGASGSGKNSIPMSLLRGIAPLIRDGYVRLWTCDPKRTEFSKLAPICYRYAAEVSDCAALVAEFVEVMQDKQRGLSVAGKRKIVVSQQTPVDLLILDELGALLAYGDPAFTRGLRRSLELVGSQGRATGNPMMGLVQEPTKDVVPVRELYTVRVSLRLTASLHVDAVLGEGARLRGALADEIPNVPDTAGIGYVIGQRTRVPMRVRAAYVTDTGIDQLVHFVQARSGLHVPASIETPASRELIG